MEKKLKSNKINGFIIHMIIITFLIVMSVVIVTLGISISKPSNFSITTESCNYESDYSTPIPIHLFCYLISGNKDITKYQTCLKRAKETESEGVIELEKGEKYGNMQTIYAYPKREFCEMIQVSSLKYRCNNNEYCEIKREDLKEKWIKVNCEKLIGCVFNEKKTSCYTPEEQYKCGEYYVEKI